MKKKRESGEVVVEASLVVSIALIFITVMLFIGIVLYHQTMLTSVANKTATSIAQLYSNSIKDPFTGYIDSESLYQEVNYSDFKTDEYVQQIEAKANALAKYRLKSASMLEAEIVDVDVDVVKKPREVLKSQVVVTIKGRYNVPLVGFFGVSDGKTSFTVTGRADCMDLLEYVNGVEAIGNPEAENIVPVMGEETCVVTFIISKEDGGFHAAVPVLKGKSIITSNHYSHSTMPRNPVLGELEFTGWVTDSGAGFNAGTTVQSDITVYGTWLCTVTFDPTGGSVSPDQMDVSYKKTANFPISTRTGYAFEGWFTQPEGKGTQYISNSTPITENITLYAHWRCLHEEMKPIKELSKGTCKTPSRWIYECVLCKYTKEDDGALGKCAEGERQIKTAATCVKNSVSYALCAYCRKKMDGTDKEDRNSALGHKLDREINTQSTCYTRGQKGVACTRTGCNYKDITYKPYAAHVYVYYGMNEEPTCQKKGRDVYVCQNYDKCGAWEYRETAKVDHDYNGRCGVRHETSSNGVADDCAFAVKGDRYYSYECIVCRWCGKFEGTKQRTLKSGRQITTSSRVWCYDHVVKCDLVENFYAMEVRKPPKSH